MGLGCDISQADRVVYADALNHSPSEATPIGPGCAACPRPACPQRAFPQAGRPVSLDLNASPDSAYATS